MLKKIYNKYLFIFVIEQIRKHLFGSRVHIINLFFFITQGIICTYIVTLLPTYLHHLDDSSSSLNSRLSSLRICLAIARDEVAAGEGALRQCKVRPAEWKTKSSTRSPEELNAWARTPLGPLQEINLNTLKNEEIKRKEWKKRITSDSVNSLRKRVTMGSPKNQNLD